MPQFVCVAACALNQWSMDFDGNCRRIIQSVQEAKRQNASIRCGAELELTGADCADHFLEPDTVMHSWEVLREILEHPDCQDIILDIGMPVRHNHAVYNCKVICLNKKILLIRPKIINCDSGVYRESRYFTPWLDVYRTEMHTLPSIIEELCGQRECLMGNAILRCKHVMIGFVICEEMYLPASIHEMLLSQGTDIILSSSASNHELQKDEMRRNLVIRSSLLSGGTFVYANLKGNTGDRVYYDGTPFIVQNGKILTMGQMFSLKEMDCLVAKIDNWDTVAYRLPQKGAATRQQVVKEKFVEHYVDFNLEVPRTELTVTSHSVGNVSDQTMPSYSASEQIAYAPACWMWDYLRRSNLNGFFLPLSGGLDSCSVAVLVHSMCRLVVRNSSDDQVLADIRRIVQDDNYIPKDPKEFAGRIFHTCFLGSENSSQETKDRAREIAEAVGSYHLNMDIDRIVSAVVAVFHACTGLIPKFRSHGGTNAENLALQNVQARLRMVLSYFTAQLLLQVRSKSGSLLVLGSSNVDEALRGYYTKYDCSSADINPIGGLSKNDLRKFLSWALHEFDMPVLDRVLNAQPTAELEPITKSYRQSDEVDMGMTYDELSRFGRLRKIGRCGPFSMFVKIASELHDRLNLEQAAEKVKRFFHYYAINRHKMTTLTPAYHAEPYSPEDNRNDFRQFLYPAWTWQNKKIDQFIQQFRKSGN